MPSFTQPTCTDEPSSITSSILPPCLSTTPLTSETLKPLLDTIDRVFAHTTRYAVAGRVALAVWGYSGPLPPHISIACPTADALVLVGWAKTAGWCVFHDANGDEEGGMMLGMPVLGSELIDRDHSMGKGKTRDEEVVVGVKLRLVEPSTWGRLDRVSPLGMRTPYHGWVGQMMRTGAQVLTVPSLVDQFCLAWSDAKIQSEGRAVAAEIVQWLLRKLVEDWDICGHKARWTLPLNEGLVKWARNERFWRPFRDRYPESKELLKRCGLDGQIGSEKSPDRMVGGVEKYAPNSFRKRVERGERRC